MKIKEEYIGFDYSAYGINSPGTPAKLTSYLYGDECEGNMPAMLVCPGGGYENNAYKEGEPIALNFSAKGYQSFVLNYSVYPVGFPAALFELSKAVAHIRENAAEYKINPDKIYVTGFSAGGHLVASLGVHWKAPFIQRVLRYDNDENKPNGIVLCYPVISSDNEIWHKGSFENLLQEKSRDEEMLELMSLEKQVSGTTPPTFLWHTFEDDCVDVRNSLVFAQALKKAGVLTELHVYPYGGHGMALCPDSDRGSVICREWIDKAIRFLGDL